MILPRSDGIFTSAKWNFGYNISPDKVKYFKYGAEDGKKYDCISCLKGK